MEKLETGFLEILARESGLKTGEIKRESELVQDLDLDSISFPTLAAGLEDIYKIAISDDQIHSMKTVGELYDYFHTTK